MKIRLAHLYGRIMNTYGDDGNLLVLSRRLKTRGFDVGIEMVDVGYKLKENEFDFYFFGGGQDNNQKITAVDLLKNKKILYKEIISRNVPLLAVCGGYQLLGQNYEFGNEKLEGLKIFPVSTKAGNVRLVGNIVIKPNPSFGLEKKIVGFENHSGYTTLSKISEPFGEVVSGHGNYFKSASEGCVVNNAIGTYLHGPILAKNPHLADMIIKNILTVKGYKGEFIKLDDEIEWRVWEDQLKARND